MNTPCKSQKDNLPAKLFGTPMTLPCSPMLKQLGYGTGIQVYRFQRSPGAAGENRSPWALKCISKHQNGKHDNVISSRLVQEANILRSLNHPNIVGFRGMKKLFDGRETLRMEECTISLGDMLEERHEEQLGPLPAVQIKKVCQDIGRALDYLHNVANLLHGDIKSFNILIKKDFEICKLCDFGVSLPLNTDGCIDVIKKPDASYVGTSVWCAPETLLDDNVEYISSKADIFSFGLVLYECIACVPPHMHMVETTIDKSVKEEVDEEIEVTANKSAKEDNEEDDELYDFEAMIGTRPPLPIDEKLGDEYNILIEIFYICTNSTPEDRPTARTLVNALESSKDF